MADPIAESAVCNPVEELGFAMVDFATITDHQLSDGAFRTLVFYLYYEQHNLEMPDVATMAKTLKRCTHTIKHYNRQLATLGYITPPQQKGWIYIVQCDRFYKIGRTNNVNRRFKEFQTYVPFALKLIHQSRHNDIIRVERNTHDTFSTKQVRGEWFELSDEDLAWLIERLEEGAIT